MCEVEPGLFRIRPILYLTICKMDQNRGKWEVKKQECEYTSPCNEYTSHAMNIHPM